MVWANILVKIVFLVLSGAEMAVQASFSGALPYVTAIVGFVEAAVVIVLGCYFDNSKKEKVARAQFGSKRDC